jgi:DNA-binding LytR/AlgR family response regulator
MQRFFSQLSANTSYTFEVSYFFSGETLLQHYKDHGPYTFHVLILDIELGGMSGMETAKKIRSLPDRDVQIIFLTSYPEYVMDSFDVQPFQYLVKPVSYDLFQTKIMTLCNYIHSSVNHFFTIKTEQEEIVVRTSDVIAIVKVKHTLAQNKLNVITTQQPYMIKGTLLEYSDKLKFPFLLIHRSVIVNLEYVHRFTATTVIMSNNDEFPLGRSQAKHVKDTYARYLVKQFNERGYHS